MDSIPYDVLAGLKKIKRKARVWLKRRDGVWQHYTVVTAPKKGYIRRTHIATGMMKIPKESFEKSKDIIIYSDGKKVIKINKRV